LVKEKQDCGSMSITDDPR